MHDAIWNLAVVAGVFWGCWRLIRPSGKGKSRRKGARRRDH